MRIPSAAIISILAFICSASAQTGSVVLERSQGGLSNWQSVPFDAGSVRPDGSIDVGQMPATAQFYRLRITSKADSSLPEGMARVGGGIMPRISGLAGATVQTFYLSRKELTWYEWQIVRTYAVNNGYDLQDVGTGTNGFHPVQGVNWHDAVKWCNAKSQMEGLTPVYTTSGAIYKTGEIIPSVDTSANGYRLPTELEWEWAARGGLFSTGKTYSGSDTPSEVAWYWGLGGPEGSRPVGGKLPNELGLYDMSGNAAEWCWDQDPASSFRRILGGGWHDGFDFCAINKRNKTAPNSRFAHNGFRLARSR